MERAHEFERKVATLLANAGHTRISTRAEMVMALQRVLGKAADATSAARGRGGAPAGEIEHQVENVSVQRSGGLRLRVS